MSGRRSLAWVTKLGTGTWTDSRVPIQIGPAFSWAEVHGDNDATCARTTAGEVLGQQYVGARRDGTTWSTTFRPVVL